MTPEHLEATEERVRVVLLEHVAIPVAVEVRRQVRETLPGASAEVLQHAVEYIAQRMNRYLAERPTALTRDVLIQRGEIKLQ